MLDRHHVPTPTDANGHAPADDLGAEMGTRLLETLQRLLAIRATALRPALDEAATVVGEALGADKLDIFLHDAAIESLVALGTSDTPMARRQHKLGLERIPLANGSRAVGVFRTGAPYVTGRSAEDPAELRGNVEALGVRSAADVPLDVDGERRGVVSAMSATPDRFTERDLLFLVAVADWIGMVTHRSELVERATADAERRGRREAANELGRITQRQREVAVLIAEGLTNAEIAQRLILTPGTVANHLEHILRRLELRGRTQVAMWAVQHGLYRLDEDDDAD